MKIFVFTGTMMLLSLLCDLGLAQTRQEVVQWLNSKGEEHLNEITGNTSLYWEVESNGTLKVTNYKAGHVRTKNVIRRYTYLNVYELDAQRPLIAADEASTELVLPCRPEAGDCIKNRYYYSTTNFKTEASPSLSFELEEKFNEEKGKELERNLLLLIRLISNQGTD